jgi:dihydroorotase
VLRPLTAGPARILRLPAGKLAAEAPADLVLFDPDIPFVLEAETLRSRSKNTPFDGRRLQGLVQRTVVGGATVYSTSAP